MAVTFTADTWRGPNTRYFAWESDLGGTPTFYLYLDGLLLGSTTRTWKQLTVAPGEQVQFEVLDSPSAVPEAAYPGRGLLTWLPSTGAKKYRIDEHVASAWTQRALVTPIIGQTWFSWQSRFLEDGQAHQFRVVPLGDNSLEGTARNFTIDMVRRPDPPSFTAAWSAGTITVDLA